MRVNVNIYEEFNDYNRWVGLSSFSIEGMVRIKDVDIVKIFGEDGFDIKVCSSRINKVSEECYIMVMFEKGALGDLWGSIYKLDEKAFVNCIGGKIKEYMSNDDGSMC